jgi:hypothetical protein
MIMIVTMKQKSNNYLFTYYIAYIVIFNLVLMKQN